jgi:hypothetical protein
MNKDEEQLKLLVIFHYVLAGVSALFACIPIIHLMIGLTMVLSPDRFHDGGGHGPPPFFGWMFVIMAGLFIILGWVYAICVFAAGRCLARRKRHLFCLVMGGVECLFMPFGTVLGVFTILLLIRDSVKALFHEPGVIDSAPPQP